MQLLSVRPNTHFTLEEMELRPTIELILILHQPCYSQNKKGDIVRGGELKEVRFITTLKGINGLIGQLQATVSGLNKMEQLSSGLNAVIKEYIK